jgi:TolA-binding protein
MVSLARSQTQLGELDAARNTLEQVLEKYPVTKAADAARKMLALMK